MVQLGDEDPLAPKLAQCRPFLREEYEAIDPALPGLLRVLHARGAGECWHKHGTFYEHLLHVYRILKLWGCPDAVARFGLFHSAYSNSYVNLAIFAPNADRSVLRDLVGDEAEALVHLFCVVPRQELIFDRLLHTLTDADLADGLRNAAATPPATGRRAFVPPEGVVVKHIRTGEDVVVPRHLVALFLLLTMADFIDQFFGWQDELFKNDDGEFRYRGDEGHALWPGDCKPGLWLTVVSRMGVLLNILLKEEAAASGGSGGPGPGRPFEGLAIPLPPVFAHCSVILPPAAQNRSRDLYWEATQYTEQARVAETAAALLKSACELNPFVAEPRLLLAQIHLTAGEFGPAEAAATEGLRLLLDWATCWDKRMTWEGWVSWARILRENARDKTWPQTAFGVLSLGLVK